MAAVSGVMRTKALIQYKISHHKSAGVLPATFLSGDRMTLSSLNAFLREQLQVLYAIEHDICRSLPKIIEGVSSTELKSLLKQHLQESERHATCLESVATQLQEKLSGGRCRAVEALLKEAVELTDRRGDDRVIDVGVISLIRYVETFEKAAYEVARAIAEVQGESEIEKILDNNLLDEERCEQSMTVLFEDIIDTIHEAAKGHPGTSLGARV